MLFWLANRVGKVVATDIYGEGIFSGLEADRTMLNDPASFSPYPYRESHLEARHMDAKQLEFEDGSFDAVFSLSSIEHFGSWADIRRSAEEIGRVLRPGGACVHRDRVLPLAEPARPARGAGSREQGGLADQK